MTTTTDDTLSATDVEALQRCIDLTLLEKDISRVEQVQAMLRERDWFEVASFCSYHQQYDALDLRPWEHTPCWVDADEIVSILAQPNDARYRAAKLAKELLDAGLSIYEPSPLQALERKRKCYP